MGRDPTRRVPIGARMTTRMVRACYGVWLLVLAALYYALPGLHVDAGPDHDVGEAFDPIHGSHPKPKLSSTEVDSGCVST